MIEDRKLYPGEYNRAEPGGYEIAGPPYTTNAGKDVQVRLRASR